MDVAQSALAANRQQRVAWPVRTGVVPPLADGFTVRADTVPGIEAALGPGSTIALVPGQETGNALDGPGAPGKTQLACSLAAALWRSRGVDLLAWVTATNRASVLSGYVRAAARLGLDHSGDAEAVAARFLAWLGGTARQWLVVLDDLRDAAVTWMLSVDYAEEMLPGGGTWPLLVLAALLDGHGIPQAVLTAPAACRYLADAAPESLADPRHALAAVLALEHAGLMVTGPASDPPAAWVSTSVQSAVRAVAAAELMSRAVQAAADALVEAWPKDQPGSVLAAQMRSCAASLLHHAGDALWAGGSCHRVLLAAGQSLASARLAGPAASWSGDVAARCERLLGGEHPDTLVAAGQMADALLAAGQAPDAVRCSRWVLSARAAMLGPAHPGVIAAMVSLGRALVAVGEAEDAALVPKDAAARSERASGPDDPGTLAVLDEYAAAQLAAGDTAGAVRSCGRALAARERLHGPADPATVAARLRLAGACRAAGKAREAIGQYQRAVATRERVLGPDHLDTLAARTGLAAAYDAAGQMGDAIQEHQRAVATRERMQEEIADKCPECEAEPGQPHATGCTHATRISPRPWPSAGLGSAFLRHRGRGPPSLSISSRAADRDSRLTS